MSLVKTRHNRHGGKKSRKVEVIVTNTEEESVRLKPAGKRGMRKEKKSRKGE